VQARSWMPSVEMPRVAACSTQIPPPSVVNAEVKETSRAGSVTSLFLPKTACALSGCFSSCFFYPSFRLLALWHFPFFRVSSRRDGPSTGSTTSQPKWWEVHEVDVRRKGPGRGCWGVLVPCQNWTAPPSSWLVLEVLGDVNMVCRQPRYADSRTAAGQRSGDWQARRNSASQDIVHNV
jgi:hypothetical protein